MRIRCKARSGFSLTESVIALVIVALVLAGSYPLMTSTTRKLYQARDHYVATTICLAQIERARDMPYDQLHSALSNDSQVRVNETGSTDPTGRFRRTTTVMVNSPDSGLTLVTVTTEMMNRRTGLFSGEIESMSYIFTSYLSSGGAS